MENLKELAPEQIGEMILKSDDWVVLRLEGEGLHVHVNSESSISLIPVLMASDENLVKYIDNAMNHIKKAKEDGNEL